MKHLQRISLAIAILALLAVSALAPAQDEDRDAAKSQALKLYNVFKTRDWKTLYDLIAFSPKIAPTVGDQDKFVADFQKGLSEKGGDEALDKLMGNISNIRTGSPILEGDKAYVPTTSVLQIEGQKMRFLGAIKLVKVSSVWKWDLSFSDDLEKATSQRFLELLGAPEKE